MAPAIKPLIWIGSSKKDLLALPDEVVDVFGYGLHLAQMGMKHPDAKPLSGFGTAGVLEIVEDWRGDMATHIERSMPYGLSLPSMCYMCSRRNPNLALPHPRSIWI